MTTIKRILVLGSERGDFFAHNVAYTLRSMGFEVFSDPGLGSSAARRRLARRLDAAIGMASRWWSQVHDRRSVNLVRDLTPDLVLVCTRTYDPETVLNWRKLGAQAICWYGDAPANIPRGHITSGEYDAVFLKDYQFASNLRHILKLPAYFLPEACNPDWHKPSGCKIDDNITFAGTMYGYRSRLAEMLITDRFHVQCYGPTPSQWASQAIRKSHTGRFLDHQNKSAVFEASLACVNTFAPAERDALNCRVFETCGSGGLLITEQKPTLSRHFEPGKEVLTFTTYDELTAHIERVRSDHEFSKRIRAKASLRAHGEHSYKHRILEMLRVLTS